ncbi:DUF6134 family protein [Paracoccus sp. (in: a-proteobacteria)]|uniref:DUF6134 family protein n=1 Tax=Paracoccus sp. TaxID=267 RepID=UPI0035B1211B
MKHNLTTAAGVFAAAMLGLVAAPFAASAAPADSVPASGRLSFDVIRKGKDIGDYVVTFRGSGADLTVDLRTDVRVKVPVIGVSAYSFKQHSTETWRGGKLTSLRSQTDDNGTPHEISVGASPLIPASLWAADLVRAGKVLNTIDGSTDAIKVRKLGTESIATGAGPVQATHYAVTGGLNRDLWYAGGKLVHVRFAAEDGSVIDYTLR